ncbi:ABC transporter ATP-binding protein [Prosthecobacter vanneervenii]|uniref:Putative ABC transport system ATP-binding protein/lipoprotein-releasing system ATP-binding protein n=1 Tax=Prosthecobacter vanneervenii TaxID=48466 RepID=A0A7W8DI63_9BACT|nr:ABC transporter ATP-binding protein [Prosthecobacter vanneervenii]MBB5030692.1 putative ABC transport system ATP-binding protein/lipoprotein-releasing system ATP-binding protein [Prosthecobacter vanneervenii]
MSQQAAPLAAQDVHRTYHLAGHDLPVLKGVNLEVAAGEKVFLCGQSGAGKTTLLYVLGGLEQPTSGDVMVHGRSLYHTAAEERARTRNQVMGFVFQHYFLLPELTALENVMLPSMIGGRKAEARARELLDKVGLSARLQHLPTELSGGEQQRVAIARALINNPGIIYADEPTGNLDASTGGGVIDMLMQVVDEAKKTLVVVTHDQTLAKRGDRRLILKEGRLEEG